MQIPGTIALVTGANRGIGKAFRRGGETLRSETRSKTAGGPRPGLALPVLATAQLMVVLDATIVNVALPHIQRALGFSGSGLEWVVNAYALAFGGLLLLGGRGPASITTARRAVRGRRGPWRGSAVRQDGELVVEDVRPVDVDRALTAVSVCRVKQPHVNRQGNSRVAAGVPRFGRRGGRGGAERRHRDHAGPQERGERAPVQLVTPVAGHAVGYGIHGVPPISEAFG
jgi:hypothetical protein